MTESPQFITLLQITDLHILSSPDTILLGVNTARYFEKIIQQAFAEQAFDLVLLTGDLAQDPCVTSYQYIRDTLTAYNTPCVCLPGNHDDYHIMQEVFSSNQITCRKHVLLNNWQVISLNSQIIGATGGYLSYEELVFTLQCLANHPHHHALIAMHHHCVETQSTWMDTMLVSNHQQFFTAIKDYPQVKAIVHGHIHQSMEKNVGTVKIWGSPSTCFQFKPNAHEFELDDLSPGYRIIRLYNDGQIQSDVIRLAEPLQGLEMHTHSY